jgi:hypothetical protein
LSAASRHLRRRVTAGLNSPALPPQTQAAFGPGNGEVVAYLTSYESIHSCD